MIYTGDNFEEIADHLQGYRMLCIADEGGMTIEFPWNDEWYSTLLPEGYAVSVNEDDYPEITRLSRATKGDWF